MKNKSVMKHNFGKAQMPEIPRSTFDRSHGHKTTFDAGYLIPIYWDEALPGDTFKMNMSAFARMATPIFPIMDNAFLDVHFFSVPMRLLWTNWTKFQGEQEDPGDSIDYTIPICTPPAGGYAEGSIFDYFGLPVGVENIEHSSLPLRAYMRVWNEWYRDQNVQNSINVSMGNGPDASTLYALYHRNKRHDYFTSCLPWPNKFDSVELPLGTSAPISGTDFSHAGDGSAPTFGSGAATLGYNAGNASFSVNPVTATYFNDPHLTDHDVSTLTADLTSATAATINEIRQAFQIQKLLEKDARGGTRYPEIIRSHFGVTDPSYAILQRPEYLGGSTAAINVTPIAQTSSTDVTTPQGNLAAMGTGALNNAGFTKSFTEHCIILGIASVRTDLTYQQGMNRAWSRSTRFDFYYPSLAHLGEQAVLSKEIYADGTANDDDVFGYQERWAEYRYKPSQITGAFRSSAATPLDSWHYSQEFATRPTLSPTFLRENPDMDRVLAVGGGEPHYLMDCYFSLKCTRPMPTYAIPGMIDHF